MSVSFDFGVQSAYELGLADQVVAAGDTVIVAPISHLQGMDEVRGICNNIGASAGEVRVLQGVDPLNLDLTVTFVVAATSVISFVSTVFAPFIEVNYVDTGGAGTTIRMAAYAYPGK